MTIEAIRARSLEYAKGHVTTGSFWRGTSKKKARGPETTAQWFARSLKHGKRAGPPPRQLPAPTNAYMRQDAGDDGIAPW